MEDTDVEIVEDESVENEHTGERNYVIDDDESIKSSICGLCSKERAGYLEDNRTFRCAFNMCQANKKYFLEIKHAFRNQNLVDGRRGSRAVHIKSERDSRGVFKNSPTFVVISFQTLKQSRMFLLL